MRKKSVFVYDRDTFAHDLRELREARGISRWSLAKKACISYNTIQLLECGGRNPSFALLTEVMKVLGVNEIRIEVKS